MRGLKLFGATLGFLFLCCLAWNIGYAAGELAPEQIRIHDHRWICVSVKNRDIYANGDKSVEDAGIRDGRKIAYPIRRETEALYRCVCGLSKVELLRGTWTVQQLTSEMY